MYKIPKIQETGTKPPTVARFMWVLAFVWGNMEDSNTRAFYQPIEQNNPKEPARTLYEKHSRQK